MNKYKNLLILLVAIGVMRLFADGMLIPKVTNWATDLAMGNKVNVSQYTTMLVGLQYLSIVFWIPVSIWIYKDAKKDYMLPWLWALLILIVHYNGLFIYLLIRLLIEKEKKQPDAPLDRRETANTAQ